MFEQIKFDLKKNVWSSTNVVIFAAFLILLLGTFFTAIGTTDNSRAKLTESYANASTNLGASIKALKKIKHKTPAQKASLAHKEAESPYFSDLTMANAGLISPVPSGSVNDLNKALLALAQFGLRETKAGHGADLELIHYDGVPLETTLIGRKKDVRFYGYLTKHKIAEIPANKANAPAAAYLPFQFLYHVSPLVILAVFIVQLGQLFTSEKREGTISFMNNLPTGKLKLLTARMATFLALTLPNFALACGVTYVITGVKFGWGTWSYPLVYSADGRTASIMTLGHYFTLVCGMLLAAVLFLMMLSALISLLSGNLGVNVVLGGITLLLATSQALGQGPLRAVAKFIPSGYFDCTKVILHQTSWPIMSIGAGIAVMLIWALALYGVCAVILARREQL